MNKKQLEVLKKSIFLRDACQCQTCKKILRTDNTYFMFRVLATSLHPYNIVTVCNNQKCRDYYEINDTKTIDLLIFLIQHFGNRKLNTKQINYLLGIKDAR